MTKTTNDKTKSGGKNSAKSSKKVGFLFAKKVRTEISKFGAKMGSREKDENSQISFISTEVPDSDLVYREILPRTYSISRLNGLIGVKENEVVDRITEGGCDRYGNELFWQWADCGFEWPRCRSWKDEFIKYGRKDVSWEAAFTTLFADNKRDWNYLEVLIRSALDFSMLGDGSPEEEKLHWVVRCLAMGVVFHRPTKIFHFEATLHKGTSRYWDKSNPSNPRLFVETRPFARFWAICCELFNYPWTHKKGSATPTMAFEFKLSLSQPTSKTKRDHSADYDHSSQPTSARVDPKDGGFPPSPLKKVSENIGSNLSLTSQDENSEGLSNRNRHKLVSPGDDDASDSESEDDSEAVQKSKKKRDKSSDDETLSESSSSSSHKKPAASTNGSPNDVGDAGEMSGDDDGGGNVADKTAGVVPEQSNVAKSSKTKKKNTAGERNKSSPPVGKISISKSNKDAAVKKLQFNTPPTGFTARKKFISESEKVRTLHQIRMDGIHRKHSKIFCIAVSWFWGGDEAEEEGATVQDRGAETIRGIMHSMFEMFPNDFLLLPFSDYQFRLKDRWLKDKATLDKIDNFQKFRIYLDLKWNNGFTISRSGQGEGNKILRARIRTASNTPIEKIENVLHKLFADTGYNMGLYSSPLQLASAVRIGWLLNYPIGIDLDELAREIMRLFNFKIPLALEAAFPINPSSTGKNYKRGTRQAIHIFAPSNRAAEVVRRLLTAYSKETPKQEMPFGAVTRFVYDWKAVRAKTIGVQPDPEISDFIVQMINAHENFGATTAVIRPNFPLRLLEQNHVEMFDEDITLLRLLYAILCTPRQAQLAKEKKDVDLGDPSSAIDLTQDSQMTESEGDGQTSAAQTEASPPLQSTTTADATTKEATPTTESTAPTNAEPTIVSKDTEMESSKASPPTEPTANTEPSQPQVDPTSKSKQPDTTSQQVSSLTNTPVIIEAAQQLPVETEEEKRVRLCQKDLANLTPAPLFLAALPSSNVGFVILVVRGKNKPIAENVVIGLASFLAYHLELGHLNPKAWRRYLRVWLGRTHIQRTIDYGMVWDPATLQAQSEFDKTRSMQIDEGNNWLDALDDDAAFQQQFDGTLTINLELASVKLMDDGTTVATRLREILRLKQIAVEHQEQQLELEQQDKMLRQQRQLNQVQADEITKLKSQLQRQAAINEQHNDTNAQANSEGGSSGDDD